MGERYWPDYLTEKQEVFCQAYVKDFNATNAAKKAGYSERSAYSTGHTLLRNPEVQKRLEELKKDRAEVLKIDAAWVLNNFIKLHKKCIEKDDKRTANNVLSNIAKHTGGFSDKLVHEAGDSLKELLLEANKNGRESKEDKKLDKKSS